MKTSLKLSNEDLEKAKKLLEKIKAKFGNRSRYVCDDLFYFSYNTLVNACNTGYCSLRVRNRILQAYDNFDYLITKL